MWHQLVAIVFDECSILDIRFWVLLQINGSVVKEDVFAEIDKALSSVIDKKPTSSSASMAAGVTH